MSIEKLIAQANARGFRVNNLFQLDTDFWRCNLRSLDGLFADFGQSTTPEGALEAALAKVPERDDVSDLA